MLGRCYTNPDNCVNGKREGKVLGCLSHNQSNMNVNHIVPNSTLGSDYKESGDWSYWLNAVANPVVFFIGLAGNLLCLVVIFGTHLRRSSTTSVYLAYLSVVDSVFLCTLVVNWLTWLDLDISLGNRYLSKYAIVLAIDFADGRQRARHFSL